MADEKLNMSPEEKDAGEKGPTKKDKAAKEKTPEPDKPKGRVAARPRKKTRGSVNRAGRLPKGSRGPAGGVRSPPATERGGAAPGLPPRCLPPGGKVYPLGLLFLPLHL